MSSVTDRLDTDKVGWTEIVVDVTRIPYSTDPEDTDYTAIVPTCKKCSALLSDSQNAIQKHIDWHSGMEPETVEIDVPILYIEDVIVSEQTNRLVFGGGQREYDTVIHHSLDTEDVKVSVIELGQPGFVPPKCLWESIGPNAIRVFIWAEDAKQRHYQVRIETK